MYKEQKNLIFIFYIVAILCISLATPVAKAALDIDWIWITSSKSFSDGLPMGTEPWCFKIQVQVTDTGSVHSIDITKPGASTPFTLSSAPGGYWDLWPLPVYASLAELRLDYPEGIYTFEFRDIDGVLVRTVNLDYSDLPEKPSYPVDFIYPSENGQIISTNPTFTWDVDDGAGDALMMGLRDLIIGDEIYWNDLTSITTTSWTPGPLLAVRWYELDVYLVNVKHLQSGPALPTMTVDNDQFEYALMIEYLNKIDFLTHPEIGTLSGWVWMSGGSSVGYSLDEDNWLYFYSPEPGWIVWNYNFNTGQWVPGEPLGWFYIDWPFYYALDTGDLWFVLPPESGLWVYHFSTEQWELLPPIIPW